MKINTLGFIGSPVLAAVFLSSSCSIRPFIQKPVASEEALGSALNAQGMFIWGRGWGQNGKCDVSVGQHQAGAGCSPRRCSQTPSVVPWRSSLTSGCGTASQAHREPGAFHLGPTSPPAPFPILSQRKRKQGCELVHFVFSQGTF